jgi:hypothetical protein
VTGLFDSLLGPGTGEPFVPGTISYWYSECRGICPSCGLDMKTQAPEYNIAPHFSGDCREISQNLTPTR